MYHFYPVIQCVLFVLYTCFDNILKSPTQNNSNTVESIFNVLALIVIFFWCLIFNEIIVLHIFDLDKETNLQIEFRGRADSAVGEKELVELSPLITIWDTSDIASL